MVGGDDDDEFSGIEPMDIETRRPRGGTGFHRWRGKINLTCIAASGICVVLVFMAASLLRRSVSDAEESRLAIIMERQRLLIGTTGDYLPFSGYDTDGGRTGIDIDLSKDLALSLNAAPVFVDTTWASVVDDLNQDKFDLAVGGISVTLERWQRCYFTKAYFKSGKVAIAKCPAKLTLEEIVANNVTIGVNKGGTNEDFADQNFPPALVSKFERNGEQFSALELGSVQAVLTDSDEAQYYASRDPELCIGTRLTNSTKGFLLPQDDTLKQYVDAWLEEKLETGYVSQVIQKYLP